MSLSLQIKRDTKLALYRQIAEQIRTLIQTAVLPPGARLPTVRQLSAELSVTRVTVQTAYDELRADGLIESIVGSGTYVSQTKPMLQPREIAAEFDPDAVFGDIHHLMHVSVVRKMAATVPDAAMFPVDEFWNGLIGLRSEGRDLLRYGTASGDMYLRVAIMELLHGLGIRGTPDEVLITHGAMHGIDLTARALARPGDVALIEEPTFLVMHNLLKMLGIRPIAIPLDNEGPRLDVLEQVLQREQPKFYYTMPNFHNPTGLCFSTQRRHDLLNLAQQHKLTILEDDTYSYLSYDGPTPTPLAALSDSSNDNIIYLGGLSKMLLPGLRVGYIHTPSPLLMQKITEVRQVSQLSGSPLIERATATFLTSGGFKRHLKRTLPVYRQRRDTMLNALRLYMPKFVSWTEPTGGFCCWLTMPRLFAPGELYRTALQQGIAVTAGEAFLALPTETDHCRLSFGNQSREGIFAGVEQLAQIIKRRAAQNAIASSESV